MIRGYVVEDKFVLIHDGSTWNTKGQTSGHISTKETVEIFETESEMNSRADELGLTSRFPEEDE